MADGENPIWGVLNAVLNAASGKPNEAHLPQKSGTALKRSPGVGGGAGGKTGFAGTPAPAKSCCVVRRTPKK